MPSVILFDIGNVLLDFDHGLICGRLAALAGRRPEEINDFLFGSGCNEAFDRGELSSATVYRELRERLAPGLTYREFVDAWCDIFTPKPGMAELVEGLRGQYRLGVLSNTNELHFSYLMSCFPAIQAVHDYHLSYLLGSLKPAGDVYRRVIDYYGLPPEEIVYTDDIPAYVDAARNAGISALHFSTAGRLADDLRDLGVTTGRQP